ncbi:MAG: HD domain-containing protein [Candidatus Thorarchaeota archaeon]|nr:HD domain-containing protein [Candidatus Thorarchaeota archaeon]
MSDDLDIDVIKLIRLTGLREAEIEAAQEQKGASWQGIQKAVDEHNHFITMGAKHTRQKAIQDPVHGAILLEPWELDIISTWEMLRLRYVRQLGPAHLVYPGATHTRFEHCIGTNFLAQKSIRVVNYCDDLDTACFVPFSRLLDEYHQKLFRAAALLHDVGHPPTSHTIEYALHSWAGLDHLDLGTFLILNSSLTDTLEKNDIEPKDVVNILRRQANDPIKDLLTEFLDHPLDIDKTDYLIRDAHFSGVQLGIFPAERVMLTNRVVKNPEGKYIRAFMLKALHSLEAFILSRNWMFSDLYLHPAVKLAEALISKATYFRMQEEDLSKNECIGLFTRMTDGDLFRWLDRSEIDFVREYSSRIRYRKLFKVVLSRSLASFEEDTQKLFRETLHNIPKLIEAENELSEEQGSVVIDVVSPPLGEKTLGKIPLLVGGEKGFDIVSLDETKEGRPLMQILKQQSRTIPSVRVYADAGIAEEIRKRFDKTFPVSDAPAHREDEYDLTEY